VTASLEKVGSVWRFKDEEDTVHEFDSNGRLVSITLRSGLNKTLQYYSSGYQAGRLQSVTDFVGRQLVFDYDTSVRISSITDPDGKQILYSYNPDGYLASVKFQDNAIRQYVYNELQFTSNVSGPWLLTGIIDESGSRFATFEYLADAERKSKATYHAGGAQKYEFSSYTADTTDVTAHVSASPVLSATRTYAFSTSLGVKRLTGITGPACPSCGPAASTYDSNGFLASSTDWNGTKTCYTHNARGLEEVRVEALPSSAQCPYTGAFTGVIRRITTEWHASYRLSWQGSPA
jgi:YD repeat-containing protein